MSLQLTQTLIPEQTLEAGVNYLLSNQHPEGYWWALLETNVCMEAEYVLLTHCLGKRNRDRETKIVRHLLHTQTETGSWVTFPGGPEDLNCTVEAYQALKLMGLSTDAEPLQKARQFIVAHGGIEQTRVFTRLWLALIGQYPWNKVPMVPPEIMFLPKFAPLNIYDFASWARATIVPLSVVMSRQPVYPIPANCGVEELMLEGIGPNLAANNGWENFFNRVDEILHKYQKWKVHPGRKAAEKQAVSWIVEHQERDGNWGGIQPPWFYSLLALQVVGMEDHPSFKKGWDALETFGVETEDGRWWFHACVSPTWDTALAAWALRSAGLPADHPALVAAGEWLLNQQVFHDGDWKVRRPKAKGGGWPFEFINDNYPDIDDTAVVLTVLNQLDLPNKQRFNEAMTAGFQWMTAMQSKNGGWGAFDADNMTELPMRIPFCDFGAVTDPPSEDVTAHVIESFGTLGYDETWSVVRKGIDYLKRTQTPEGSWFGRWGVNHLYGTGAVLSALPMVGVNVEEKWVQKALDWLEAHQNEDGGWGESCLSYDNPKWIGQGESTPSQTGWALIGLIAGGRVKSKAVERGIAYLCKTQRSDGGWEELLYTGTGFPGDFYIGYRLYGQVFPVLALGRYKQALTGV